MAQGSALHATPSSVESTRTALRAPLERDQPGPTDWPGPHLARLNAWAERRQRILVKIAQRTDQHQDA